MRALLLLSAASLFACGENSPTPTAGNAPRDGGVVPVAAKADAAAAVPTKPAPASVPVIATGPDAAAGVVPVAAPAPAGAWADLTVADANFSVSMPGKSIEVPTPNSDPRFRTRAWAVPQGAIEWGIGWNKYSDMIETPDIKPILDGGQNGFLKGFAATVTEQHDIKLAAHVGRDFQFETDNFPDIHGHVKGRTQIFIVGDQSYQLMLFYSADTAVPAADQERFFHSLHLLHDPGPVGKKAK